MGRKKVVMPLRKNTMVERSFAVFQILLNEQTRDARKNTKQSTNFQSHNLLEPTRIHLLPT
jgi:hypothetical protein